MIAKMLLIYVLSSGYCATVAERGQLLVETRRDVGVSEPALRREFANTILGYGPHALALPAEEFDAIITFIYSRPELSGTEIAERLYADCRKRR